MSALIRHAAFLSPLLLFAASVIHADDWPQYRGPKRNGTTSEKVAAWTKETAPKVVWRADVGNGFASPIVANGKLFIHSRGSDAAKEEEEVVAYDAATGEVAWRDTYARPKFESVLGTGPRAAPMVAGKRLYTMGINGVLTSYDAESGQRNWQVDLYARFKADLPAFAVCCSPLVVGNRVIISVGGKEKCIVGLDVETGETMWQALDDEVSTSSGILFSAGMRPGSTPDAVFITPLRTVGLDPIDGALRWEYPLVFQAAGTSPMPLAFGNKIIVSTQAHGAVAVNVKEADDKLSAEAAWQMPEVKSYFSTGVASGKQLILVTNVVEILPSASLTCLDGETGKELWKKKGVGYFAAGVIKTGDDKLLVLNDSGRLSLLEYDDKQVKEVSSASVCGGTLVAPILADGRLYVRDSKEVICWEFSK